MVCKQSLDKLESLVINMQKIYLNKETNIVEQIIKEDYDHFESYTDETFGDKFYMVEDLESEVDGYSYIYDLESLKFKRVTETKEFKESVVEPSETQIQIKGLKEENKNLNNKLDLILQQQLEIQNYIARALDLKKRRTVNER